MSWGIHNIMLSISCKDIGIDDYWLKVSMKNRLEVTKPLHYWFPYDIGTTTVALVPWPRFDFILKVPPI
jgi:hypothetical protein